MARIIILGSAAAVSDAEHDNTHFILNGDTCPILVDCGSNPLGKLHKLGIDDHCMTDMILTHFHPDHVSGVPNMLMHMWLLGRSAPLRIYGLAHCLDRIEEMMLAFSWDTWPNFFPVTFHRVQECDRSFVMENDDFVITAFPTKHFIPTIGLRVTNKVSGRVLAYTCDTEPIPGLVDLGRGADILIHESAGKGPGHSSAQQAGTLAAQCAAKSLYLIHYQVWNTDPVPLVAEARQVYSGPVALARDFDEYEF
ncbi:MAG: MBL fold metallo-hydrolase [Anaerolineae bacterium]|nr:MBL fold metallo-hydrolase [Anaerolineae bacterium]